MISKNIAEQRATNLGNSKLGFQVSIQYCIEQSLQGNADAATRIFRLAKMINAKGDLLADGRSVLDYLDSVLDFKLLNYRKEKGDLGLVKDWSASVDGLDLAAMFVTQQETPWATWKKPAPTPPEQTLLAAIASLEKKIQKAQKASTAITASDRETMLGTLALLSTAIENMPEAEEPETEVPTPMVVIAKSNPELAKVLVAEVREEEEREERLARTFASAQSLAKEHGTKVILDCDWALFTPKQQKQLFVLAGEKEAALKIAA